MNNFFLKIRRRQLAKVLILTILLWQSGVSAAVQVIYSAGDTLGADNPVLANYEILFQGVYAGTQVLMQMDSGINVYAGFTVQGSIAAPPSTIYGDTTNGSDGIITIINSGSITQPVGQTVAIDLGAFATGTTTGPNFSLQNNAGGVINGMINMPQPAFSGTSASIVNQGTIIGHLLSNAALNPTNLNYTATLGAVLTGSLTIPARGATVYSADSATQTGNITCPVGSLTTVAITLQNQSHLIGNINLTNNNAAFTYTLNNSVHTGSIAGGNGVASNTTFNFLGAVNSVSAGIIGAQNVAANTSFNFNGGSTSITGNVLATSTSITTNLGAIALANVNISGNYQAGDTTLANQSSLTVGGTLTLTTANIGFGSHITAGLFTASGPVINSGSLYLSGAVATFNALTINGGYNRINATSFNATTLTVSGGNSIIAGSANLSGNLAVSAGVLTFNSALTVANNLELSGGTINFANTVTVTNAGSGVQNLSANINFYNNVTLAFNAANSVTIGSSGNLSVFGNFTVSGQDLNNNGILGFIGNNSTLTTTNYIVTGTHRINFQGENNVGLVTVVGNVDLSNAAFVVNITESGDLLNNTYPLMSATGTFIAPTNISVSALGVSLKALTPTVSFDIPSNSLILSAVRNNNLVFPLAPITEIWQAFNIIQAQQSTNPDLAFALNQITSMVDANSYQEAACKLTQLLPQSSSVKMQEISVQAVFNALNLRVAALQASTSYQAGEVDQSSAIWLRSLFSRVHRSASSEYLGYKAMTIGVLGGIDFKLNSNFMFGGALGYTKNFSTENINTLSKNYVYAVQLVPYFSINFGENGIYGALDLFYAYAWNNVHSRRMVNISNYSSKYFASYKNYQSSGKVIYSKILVLNKEFSFIPKVSAMYSHSPQVTFVETGYSLSLQSTTNSKSLYELATGLNIRHQPLNFENDLQIELRLLGFWNLGKKDLVSSGNFLLGGSNFSTKIKTDRIGGQFGVSILGALFKDPAINLELSYDFRFSKYYYENSFFVEARYLF